MTPIGWATVAALGPTLFLLYVILRYVPIIERNAFEIPRHRAPADYVPPAGTVLHTAHCMDAAGRAIEITIAGQAQPFDRVVVFCHETGAGAASWVKHAAFLPGEGIDVVSFCYENNGLTYQWPSQDERTAIEAVLGWLYRERKGAHVALFGVSKGAVLALAASQHFSVKAVVLDGAFSSLATLKRFMKKWVSIYVTSQSTVRRLPNWLFAFLARVTLAYAGVRHRRRFFSAEGVAARLDRPSLFIHAENDSFADRSDVETLRKSARKPGDLWLVPGAGHSDSAAVCPEEYRLRVLNFLNRHLG